MCVCVCACICLCLYLHEALCWQHSVLEDDSSYAIRGGREGKGSLIVWGGVACLLCQNRRLQPSYALHSICNPLKALKTFLYLISLNAVKCTSNGKSRRDFLVVSKCSRHSLIQYVEWFDSGSDCLAAK